MAVEFKQLAWRREVLAEADRVTTRDRDGATDIPGGIARLR